MDFRYNDAFLKDAAIRFDLSREEQWKSSGSLNVKKTEIGIITKNLEMVGEIVSSGTSYVIGAIMVDLLGRALPRTPLETGELRESGRAQVQISGGRVPFTMMVGYGTKEGTVKANLGKLQRKSIKTAKYISGSVSFHKIGWHDILKQEVNVAWWVHENIYPYDSDNKPHARTPGTGPKYLELPWLQNKAIYANTLKRALDGKSIAKAVQLVSKITAKAGKYEYDQVEITNNLSEMYGYFESATPRRA